MKKRMFRRVKEGPFRLGMYMVLAGMLMLPVPLLAQTEPAEGRPQAVWQTELVLADASPDLLRTAETAIAIEKVSSRYTDELEKQEAERKNVAREAEQARLARQATVDASPQCSTSVTEQDKWDLTVRAASAYGIPPELLGAVWQVESGKQFCTSVHSYAGAKGPFQFVQGTWNTYGKDGNGDGIKNVYDARDAAFGAAHLLAANGANRGDYRRALLAYNHANWYVSKVLAMAKL